MMVGVRRDPVLPGLDSIPSGSERLIEDQCIRKMINHPRVEIQRIVLLGGCEQEGKIYQAQTTSKPSWISCIVVFICNNV